MATPNKEPPSASTKSEEVTKAEMAYKEGRLKEFLEEFREAARAELTAGMAKMSPKERELFNLGLRKLIGQGLHQEAAASARLDNPPEGATTGCGVTCSELDFVPGLAQQEDTEAALANSGLPKDAQDRLRPLVLAEKARLPEKAKAGRKGKGKRQC